MFLVFVNTCVKVLFCQVMDYSTQTKTVHCHLKNMVVKKLSRAADRRAAELVTEEKFGVYFQCLVSSEYTFSV